jgi:hypothetical protein
MESKLSRGKIEVDEEEEDGRRAAKSSGSKVVEVSSISQGKALSREFSADSKNGRGSRTGEKEVVEVKERMEFKDEKTALMEIQEELDADEEFERLKNQPTIPISQIARTPFARDFVRGFSM